MTTNADTAGLSPELRKLTRILILGAIAALLDTTVVNLAIDVLSREFDAPVSTIQWVNTSYLLALGIVIPVSGWSAARFGGKQMWMFALALFLLGSVLSGLAWSVVSLIIFRVVQGVGGGLLFPIQQTLLVQAAGGKQLGRVMAAITLPVVVVPILGPVVGGLILNNLSWRWIFYINVPICLIAIIAAHRGIPDTPKRGGQWLDLLGLSLLSPGLALLLFGLSQADGPGGFGRPVVLGSLVAGVLLLAAFVAHALRTRHEPAVDVRLFRIRSFAVSGVLRFLSGLTLFSGLLVLPLYYQQVRGYGVLAAGLLTAPQGLGSLIVRSLGGQLIDRVGARPVVIVSTLVGAVGTIPFALGGWFSNLVVLGGAQVVRGAGLSLAAIAMAAASFEGLSREQVPHASSTTRILQQVGSSFGVAVLALVLQQQITSHSGAGTGGLVAAYQGAFWWIIAFTVLGALPAFLMPGKSAPRATAAPEARPESVRGSAAGSA
ncbi:MDR family MFS transporter [Micromonospora rifamycinica]|uniref:MDR family MFS transporter n=1 Tax=Micromonospora rifamycinica TaxID=291594 RepID=UPI0034156B1B